MKALAFALPLAAVAGSIIGVHAATPWFGPHADELVSIAGTTGPVANGSSYVLATVPASEHLVLSGITLSSVPLPNTSNHAPWGFTLLQRDSSGAVVMKCPVGSFSGPSSNIANQDFGMVPLPATEGLGVVFDPGTEIVLRYQDASGGSYPNANADYLLIGHYASR